MKKAFGRARGDFEPLLPGEVALVECARRGEIWSAPFAPDASDPRRPDKIRGAFLRFLVLGGDDATPVHEKGPRIRRALVSEDLDFTGCKDMRVFVLEECVVEGSLLLEVAKTASIYLDGTDVERVQGNRAEISGSIYMRFGFVARRGLDLSGSRVTGSISCRGATFKAGPEEKDEPVSYCFRLDDAEVVGTLILGPRHPGDMRGANAARNRTVLNGTVSLQGTKCAALFDCEDTYAAVNRGELRIHGFRYGRLAGIDAADSGFRRRWLDKAYADGQFTSPQTYEYLATVLREMGHDDEAKTILIDRQRLERHVRRRQQAEGAREIRERRPDSGGFWRRSLAVRYARWACGTPRRLASRLWNRALYTLFRYGYEPWRALVWSLVPIAIGVIVFGSAYRRGAIIPTEEVVATAMATCLGEPNPHASLVGRIFLGESGCEKLEQYPRFSAFWYSFDTFIPIVSVKQSVNWMPKPSSPYLRQYLSFHTLVGWLFLTLGLLNMTGTFTRRAAPGGK